MFQFKVGCSKLEVGCSGSLRQNFPLKFKRPRLLLAAAALLLLGAMAALCALYFSPNLLCIQDQSTGTPIKADAIVVLGGEVLFRPPRTLELYQQGAAPRILVTGLGDCEEYRTLLVGKGIPQSAIQLECQSRTTRENAQFSVPLLRAMRARRAIIVTSWFHSRRALHCFGHYAPEIEFISMPTTADLPRQHWTPHERSWVMKEYLKIAGYWLCYGIPPV